MDDKELKDLIAKIGVKLSDKQIAEILKPDEKEKPKEEKSNPVKKYHGRLIHHQERR